MTDISREKVLSYRLQVNHLAGDRLKHNALATAAIGGLQDGSPISGLLSLAARVEEVGPNDWCSDALAQVFGPRGTIYIVRHEDIASAWPLHTEGRGVAVKWLNPE